MTVTEYYRRAIWLPLLAGALALALSPVVRTLPPAVRILPGTVQGVVASGTVVAGAPYVLFALWMLWLIKGRTEPDLRRYAKLAPVYFVPFYVLGSPVLVLVTAESVREALTFALMTIPLVLLYGYVYVGIAFWGTQSVTRAWHRSGPDRD